MAVSTTNYPDSLVDFEITGLGGKKTYDSFVTAIAPVTFDLSTRFKYTGIDYAGYGSTTASALTIVSDVIFSVPGNPGATGFVDFMFQFDYIRGGGFSGSAAGHGDSVLRGAYVIVLPQQQLDLTIQLPMGTGTVTSQVCYVPLCISRFLIPLAACFFVSR